jgi:sirohydrochlorin cobaltochelatase
MSKGIMIAGYGTRDGNIEEVLETQAKRLRARGWKNVYIGYFRVNAPSIPEALSQMVADGVDEIVVLPYYIAEGTLTKELIPEKLGLTANPESGKVVVDGKEVSISMASAFEKSFTLTDIICDKIADAEGTMDDGILILGHGTRFRSKNNMLTVKVNAERVAARGYGNVRYAFNEYCEPTIPAALEDLERAGVDRIIAIPLFIAMGIHPSRDIPEKLGIPPYSDGGEITVNGRTIRVTYTRPVEANPRLIDEMDQKALEYLGGYDVYLGRMHYRQPLSSPLYIVYKYTSYLQYVHILPPNHHRSWQFQKTHASPSTPRRSRSSGTTSLRTSGSSSPRSTPAPASPPSPRTSPPSSASPSSSRRAAPRGSSTSPRRSGRPWSTSTGPHPSRGPTAWRST